MAKLGWLVATLSGTYGISSGNTSARILMESVLALEVGAAARRIFSKAICRKGQAWRDAPRKGHSFLLLQLLKPHNFKPTL